MPMGVTFFVSLLLMVFFVVRQRSWESAQKIAAGEKRLAEAQKIALLGSWESDLIANTLSWSHGMNRIFEVDTDLFGYSYEAFLELVHPEDRGMVDLAYRTSVKNKTPYKIEHRLKLSDGRVKFVLVHGEIFYDRAGTPIRSMGTIQDITDRKQAEEALQESERRLADIINFLPDATLVIDRQGTVIAWNRAIEELTGIKAEQMLGKNNYEYAIPLYGERRPILIDLVLNPHEEYEKHYADIKRKGDVLSGEAYTLARKGGNRYLYGTASPLHDSKGDIVGAISTIRDITDRKTAEEVLRHSEQKMRLHVQQTPLAVIEWDTAFHVISWNPAAERIFGYTAAEAIGQHVSFIVPETARERVREIIEALQKQRAGEQSTNENITRDGRIILCEWYNTPLTTADGSVIGVVSLAQDITTRMEAEKKLRDLSLLDELTGLSNRRGFLTLGTQQVKIADRLRQGLALIYADLDKMKWINDTFGHKVGDQALIDAAFILKSSFRASDIVARLGGDEFVGLVLETADHTGEAIMSRLQENLNACNLQANRQYALSISFGITRYDPQNPCSLEELLERGDKVMYEQKKKKRLRRTV